MVAITNCRRKVLVAIGGAMGGNLLVLERGDGIECDDPCI